MANSWIQDGQDRTAFCAGETNLYDDLRFTYRPMTMPERSRWISSYRKIKEAEQDRFIARMMKERIKEWDVSLNGDKTNLLPLSVDNLLRLQPKLFNRISAIILGEQGSDEDPEAVDKTDQEEDAKAAEDAAANDTVLLEERQRKSEGN